MIPGKEEIAMMLEKFDEWLPIQVCHRLNGSKFFLQTGFNNIGLFVALYKDTSKADLQIGFIPWGMIAEVWPADQEDLPWNEEDRKF